MSEADHQFVRQGRVGAVLELVIDSPPVNALSQAVRAGLLAGIEAAEADAAVAAVVIRAGGRTFPAGADIAEFGQPPRAPLLPDLCNRIEACAKPVVAALHGTALGGGLEIALAAHLRLALAGARLGFPEVGLGILPGAGGTQRLPRLIGAEPALRLMLGGQPVSALEALALGLVDRVVESDLAAQALAMAEAAVGLVAQPTRQRRSGMRDPVAYQAAVAAARAALHDDGLPAPLRIVDCVEAALLLPFDQGLAFERTAFLELVTSPEALGLRHAFFGERALARLPEAKAAPRPLQSLAVFGAAATEPALALLQAGFPVTLVDTDRPALVAALEQIAARQEAAVAAGTLTAEARDADWARLTPALATAALAGADLVLVAGAEGLAAVLAATRPGSVLALLDGATGGADGRAADVLGLRFSPSGAVLAELIVGLATAPDAVATALLMLRRLGRVGLRVQASGDLARPEIGAQVLAAGQAAAAHLAAAGVAPASIAAALAQFGLPGIGVAPTPGAAGHPAVGAGEIITPVLAAMANAGARLVGQGVVQRPSDIDLALILGHGFPRWQGGPMHWADRRGLLILRNDLRHLGVADPAIWGAAPLIDALIGAGLNFADMNAASIANP